MAACMAACMRLHTCNYRFRQPILWKPHIRSTSSLASLNIFSAAAVECESSRACSVRNSPPVGRTTILRAACSSLLLLSVLLNGSAGAIELPANYVKFARKLLTALRDSIEADMSPASEAEVRRKADPAKTLVKEWVANWRDVRAVSGDVSFREIKETLQLLGDFYLKKGQRTRLPPELGSDILRRLDAASAALPT